MLPKTKNYEISLKLKGLYKKTNINFNLNSLFQIHYDNVFKNSKCFHRNEIKFKIISNKNKNINNHNYKNIYKYSQKTYLNKDYSHLHIESTDKIYPKIRYYEYDYDLRNTETILKEFNYLYESEDFDEALNKGFLLLNFLETNPKAKIQTIDLILLLTEIFINQVKLDIADKLLYKVENRLNLEIFKNLDLFYIYTIKSKLLRAIINIKNRKEKEAILLLKDIQDILKNTKYLEQENIDINIASDYLSLLLFQADIYKNNNYLEKYKIKLIECIEFFKNHKNSNFDVKSKKYFIERILQFFEIELNKDNFDKKEIDDKFYKTLKEIEKIIFDIKNGKSREEFKLRITLIFSTLDLDFFKSNHIETNSEIFDFIEDLKIDINSKEEIGLKILNLYNKFLYDNIYDDKNSNNSMKEIFIKKLFNNYIKLKKIIHHRSKYTKNNNYIIDNCFLSFSLEKFYENYIKIKKSNFNNEVFDVLNKFEICNWSKQTKKDIINIINYTFLYKKNQKIIDYLNETIDNPLNKNKNIFVEINENKNNSNIINLKDFEELDIVDLRKIIDTIFYKKIRIPNVDLNNKNMLESINRYIYKKINIMLIDKNNSPIYNKNSGSQYLLLDNIIIKCFLLDSVNFRNSKNLKNLKSIVDKIFKISITKPNMKLNRNRKINDVNIDLFEIKNFQENLENISFFKLVPNSSLIDNNIVYSDIEINKKISTLLILSITFFKLAQENFNKLVNFFKEENKNNYFKNISVIRNNVAERTINHYSNFSLKILSIIFDTKNESINYYLKSLNNDKDLKLVYDLKKLVVYNFLLKINVSIYFSNVDCSELLESLKENKKYLDFIENNDREEILKTFNLLEMILEQNINNI